MSNQKKKILAICDHPLSTSGVGTQARWLIQGLLKTGKYKFICLGAAMSHENHDVIAVTEDFIIKPIDGFGNRDLIRQILAVEKPDAVFIFTDPRFFIWLWECEDEVHQICPIVYWHLWDNAPYPEFNSVLYESTDLINCINYPTYEMLKDRFPDKTNFIPHALPSEVYYPMSDEVRKNHKANLIGLNKQDDFVALWVSRNARRKMPSDVLVSWSMFIKELKEKYGHTKATLIMHTDPLDKEGPNLQHVVNMLNLKDNVVFSKERIEFDMMNVLYNISDCLVSISCAEGFGLSLLEGMQTELPVIALKTGGMTRQVVNHKTNEQNGIALDPEVKVLVGNQMIPYIYEDYICHETVSKAYMKMYEMGSEGRHEVGKKARQYVLEEFNIDDMISNWDRTMSETIEIWKEKHKKWEVISI